MSADPLISLHTQNLPTKYAYLYMYLYRTKENLIEILTVIHQARDLTNILERI